jgi:hypothetical protein
MTTTTLADTVGRVLPQDMARRLQAVGAEIGEADGHARHLIQKRPLVTLAIAMASGYLLARLLRPSREERTHGRDRTVEE